MTALRCIMMTVKQERRTIMVNIQQRNEDIDDMIFRDEEYSASEK